MMTMLRKETTLKYYSREILEQYLKDTPLNKILDIIDETEPYLTTGKTVPAQINVRLCRECEYFERKEETNRNFDYCSYRTDFAVLDDEPIHWYFTDINGFCREDDIND